MNSLLHAIAVALQKAIGLPAARLHYASARDSLNAEDWEAVIRHAEAVHRWHWASDESRYMLGCACAEMRRFDEAVAQLRAIRRTLKVPQSEQTRWLNLAVSLHYLGRFSEALEILPPDEIEERFPDYAEPAKDLRAMIMRQAKLDGASEPQGGLN